MNEVPLNLHLQEGKEVVYSVLLLFVLSYKIAALSLPRQILVHKTLLKKHPHTHTHTHTHTWDKRRR